MKRIILLLLFLAGPFLAKSQVVPSSCIAHDTIISKYRSDAQRLALKKIYRQNLPYKDSVFIPKSHSDTVLKALIAVYNATSLPARDTVVRQLDIHSFPRPDLNHFYIIADSSENWMQQLKLNNLATGNASVDSLILKYQLKVFRYIDYANSFSYHQVVFESDSSYNMPVVETKFHAIPGLFLTGPFGRYGDGNTIQDSIYSTHVELTYSYGWMDCPMGCIHRRYWKFKVYYDCSVEFIGSYGDSYHITGIQEKEPEPFSIYPNPFQNSITLNGFSKPVEYTIYDLLGQKLRSGRTTDNKIEDLEKLHPGLYLLRIKAGNKQWSFKIIK